MMMKLACRTFLKLYGLNSIFEKVLLFKRTNGVWGFQFEKIR